MNTPQYLPSDMAPPIPVVAPSKDDILITIHTRMTETEQEIQLILVDSTDKGGG